MSMTVIEHAPRTLSQAAASLRAVLGTRFAIVGALDAPASTHHDWQTLLADDTMLHRRVVVRVGSVAHGDTGTLHDRVHRARLAARVNAHLVSRVYDAAVTGGHDRSAPPAAQAAIVSEYFEGPTLRQAMRTGQSLDGPAVLAELQHRIEELTDSGVSLGELRPDDVILTASGCAISALPRGTVSQIGTTRLEELTAPLCEPALGRLARRIAGAGRARPILTRFHVSPGYR